MIETHSEGTHIYWTHKDPTMHTIRSTDINGSVFGYGGSSDDGRMIKIATLVSSDGGKEMGARKKWMPEDWGQT